MRDRLLPLALLSLLALVAPAALAAATAPSSCIACHGNADMVGKEGVAIVHGVAAGVHAANGLSCEDCHGGNPDPALAEDMVGAMDEGYAPNPFRGAPKRTEIPAFCGRCHSDPVFMKRFKPDARVDQEREYHTSRHGQLLAKGDERVATCVDCHGVHGIQGPSDPASPVYPTHVAETCSHCHADPKHMAGYKLPDGRPLPVDQYARWRQSVHAQAMFEKEDLSAPTCNDCHGNHGAVPPGLNSITFVCGQCHGREAELFRASPKEAAFRSHADYLAQAGADGCAACHAPPEPQAELTSVHSFGECTTCHGNHGVVRPTVAMLSPLPEIPCTFCHGTAGPLEGTVSEPEKTRRHFQQVRDSLLAQADAQHLEGEQRFDWLVDQALGLPPHTLPSENGTPPKLRPEFKRLFTKFRIGKTYYTYKDPATGKEVQAPVLRCASCHSQEPAMGGEPVGYDTAKFFLTHMEELTARTARAERMLLAARRGGVETRKVAAEIDQAVDSQIQLEVLVHTFSDAEGGKFLTDYEKGRGHAEAALTGARRALNELTYRRKGLVVFLIFIVLVLVGLALKIRQLSQG